MIDWLFPTHLLMLSHFYLYLIFNRHVISERWLHCDSYQAAGALVIVRLTDLLNRLPARASMEFLAFDTWHTQLPVSCWVVFGNCKNWRQTIYDGKTSANCCESWTVQGRILPVSTCFARLVFSPEIATACLALPCSSCKSANNMESWEENPLVHNIWMVQKWWKFRMIDKGSCSFRHRKYLPRICYSCYFASNFSLRENLHKLSTLSGRPPSTKHHFCSHKLLWRFLMICIRNPPLRFVIDHDHRQ